jgi:hypothetical protein
MISVFPTIAAAGIVLGGVIDYGTGAVYNLQPNPVVANLRCPSNGANTTLPTVTPAATVIPISDTLPPPALPSSTSVSPQNLPRATADNEASAVDTQLRNLDREFRAGKISLDEYRKIKKVLKGDGQ